MTRELYTTDASHYRLLPAAVAFPRNASEASAAILAAGDAGQSVVPRGAGTGLVGGALGEGLVIDFARFNRAITGLDLERRTVRVGAGVVLDQLNAFLKPHGFCFGPDVATSSRATIGGMIANNSSGARVPVYGVTADHVLGCEVVMADGRIAQIGCAQPGLGPEREFVDALVQRNQAEIRARMPAGILKRWPGYGLDRWLRRPGNLSDILAGSEGTLAAITAAELRILPLPKHKGLGLVFFASVAEAMQATVELLPLKPAAIEHVDRVLFDQTRGQLAFQAARDLMRLDCDLCEAFLIVEFYEDVSERLQALASKRLGLRTLLVTAPAEMNLVWGLRKAGLSLLTGRPGKAKPVTGIEDTAVRPEQLPAYVADLESLMRPFNLDVCYYGHAAAGLLHVRPVLDLRNPEDLRKFRQLGDSVSALVRQYRGSLAAEHGVGMARTEYLADHLGDTLLGAMRDIKLRFDPGNRLNPDKLFNGARFKLDKDLRIGTGRSPALTFDPILAFAAKDRSFLGNLEQCNGCGGCRKETPTMCPTFAATGEEIMSTRGRANIIRAVLEGEQASARDRSGTDHRLSWSDLAPALSNCLSCKACATECPSNVNLPLLKAELQHAEYAKNGVPLRARLISAVDLLGRLGCMIPEISNRALKSKLVRRLMRQALQITTRRPLPSYASERFDHWFDWRRPTGSQHRRRVLLWDDTFVRYHEPHVGKAAVRVLEGAGFKVALLRNRKCCGRPAFSQGHLDEVRRLGAHNLRLLLQRPADEPIIFLEPSCFSMLKEDYRELKLPGAEQVSSRCFLFEDFIENLLRHEPQALAFRSANEHLSIHAHCHAKSLQNPGYMARLAGRLPGRTATLLETGCCGMAGAFGATESKYDLSIQVGSALVAALDREPAGSVVIASGTSCRHQIEHMTPHHPKHMAEVLAAALPE